jgi:uncharacterized delta-60 repeat protein
MKSKFSIYNLGLCLCAVLCSWQASSGAPGDLDTTFSGDGFLTDFFPGYGNDTATALARQADGKLVVVGSSDHSFDRACSVSRFNPDGSLDISFGGTGKALVPMIYGSTSVCDAVALQPDGKIVVAGYISDDADLNFALFRLNPDGSADLTFGGTGRVMTSLSEEYDGVNALAIQSDGKIVAAGFAHNSSAIHPADFALVRYNPDGSLDTSFDTDGVVITSIQSTSSGVRAIALQPDGKIVAAGDANSDLAQASNFAVVRYNTNGSLDTSFGGTGKVLTPSTDAHGTFYDVAIQPDGKIVAVGETYGNNTGFNFVAARYNTNGSLDTSFDSDGIANTAVAAAGDGARAVAVQPDGKIVAAGYAFRGSTLYDFVLVRYNPNGSLDTSFGTNAIVRTQFSSSTDGFTDVALQLDGKIIGIGTTPNGGDTDFTVLRYNTNGALDTSFDTDGIAFADIGEAYALAEAVAVQADGKIVVAGYAFNGTNTDFAVARYNADGSPDTSFGGIGRVLTPVSSGSDYANALVIQPDGKIVVAGSVQTTSSTVFALVRYNADGSLDTSFDTDGKVTTAFFDSTLFGAKGVALQPDGKIVAVGLVFTAETDFALARYNANGSLDTTFDTDGRVTTDVSGSYDYANAVAVQPDGKIVVAGYADGGSFNWDFALVRYNANGSLDTSFDSDGKVMTPVLSGEDEANAVTIQTNGKIVAAGYADNGTDKDFALVRYNADGSPDTSFGGTGKVTTPVYIDDDVANAVVVQPDGKIIAAGQAVTSPFEDFALVRYNANGSLDTAYGAGGKSTFFNFTAKSGYIQGVALDSLGRAVVAGVIGGRIGVARILGGSGPTPPPATIQFSNPTYTVSESAGFANVNVTRSGDTSTGVAVDYSTSDNSNVIPDEAQAVALCGTVNGGALSKCDFNTALGTLSFAPGETTKSFTVLVTQDSYVEGTERAPLTLSNPTNASVLGSQSTAVLEIMDDPTEPPTNAIDDARNFVRQHYHDFLNREPDQAGWDFWTDNIAKCNNPARLPAGQTVEQCIDKQRETTSGAFFLSPEFQYTGSYIYAVYKGSLNRRPTFLEFMRDLRQLVNGIIVGGQISGPVIEANRAQYVAQFVQRPEFTSIYAGLSNQGYVDKLFLTTGTSVSNADKQALVTGLDGGSENRFSVLHKVVNGTRVIAEGQIEIIAVYGKTFFDTQFNPAFVQMDYFGYMRRNEDTSGFNFWLDKLNFYGDFITAEMVRSFLLSPEYRRRFGSQ